MPSREQVIEKLVSPSYSRDQVKHILNSINSLDGMGVEKYLPNKLKFGDVAKLHSGTGVTPNKPRPFVIVKVMKEESICIPLSSTDDWNTLIKGESRFFKESNFTKNIIVLPNSMLISNFVAPYDNRKVLTAVKKELKKYYRGFI